MKYNLRNIMMGCLGVGIIMSVTSAAGAANVLERALVEKTAYALITAQNSDINQSYMQFDKDSMIELADTMYDFRENPSAYKYNVYAENGDYEGYIILGAQDCYAPIIEYGFRNQDARAQIIEEKPEGKLYYTGGIGYLVERKDANGVSVYIDSETRNVVTRQNIEQNDYNREDFQQIGMHLSLVR